MNTVFTGNKAVLALIDPDNNPPLPLVEIPASLNPFYDDDVHIYIKLLNLLPLHNVKSLPAYNMLIQAQQRGELKNVENLVENSSGNTIYSLAIIASILGIKNTEAYVSHEVSQGKLELLRFFGITINIHKEAICPDPNDQTSGIYKAQQKGKTTGWYNAGQYHNPDNPHAHYRWTGKQLYQQLGKSLRIFCAGLGTTGTLLGASKYLKEHLPTLTTIGVVRAPNNPVPGPRTRNLLQEIAFDWQSQADELEEVGTKEAYTLSLRLCRAGLIVGPSSGFNLAGLLQFLKKKKKENYLNQYRNKEGKIICACIACDNPYPYIQEYFKFVDSSQFPKIKNIELLSNTPNNSYSSLISAPFNKDVSVTAKKAFTLLQKKRSIELIDIRSQNEFIQYHIPQSKNMPAYKVIEELKKDTENKKKTFLICCSFGTDSNQLATLIQKNGYKAYSIEDGIVEWSRLNFPRNRHIQCILPHHKEISSQQVRTLIKNNEVTIVDLRSPNAYTDKHIEGSINIPEEILIMNHSLLNFDIKKKLLFVCNKGVSSLKHAVRMQEKGFMAFSLQNGMIGWK